MKRYDLHVHTDSSKCGNLRPKDILKIAKKKSLQGIAITDHNIIKGARDVKRFNKDKGFEVIIGEEIETELGEVIGLYLKKEIKPGSFEKVVSEIKNQGGLVIVPHPYDFFRRRGRYKNWEFNKIYGSIDAIEIFNSRMIFNFINRKAKKTAEQYSLAKVGGSDGHFSFEIGRGLTFFEGDLRKAIKEKRIRGEGSNKFAFFGMVCTILRKYLRIL